MKDLYKISWMLSEKLINSEVGFICILLVLLQIMMFTTI